MRQLGWEKHFEGGGGNNQTNRIKEELERLGVWDIFELGRNKDKNIRIRIS